MLGSLGDDKQPDNETSKNRAKKFLLKTIPVVNKHVPLIVSHHAIVYETQQVDQSTNMGCGLVLNLV